LSYELIGRRGLLALAAALAIGGPAAADLPRQDPKACKGQPEIKPLEPLQIRTDRGLQTFSVEIADSPTEQEFGLMCRKALAPDRGMLFIFPNQEPRYFWMRNTLIPLDIVYIGGDGKVVSITRSARPLDETPLPSGAPAKYVLELAGGRAAQIGLLPGDRVLYRTMPRG
jgi:uncharacterized membrane protein (UPF0127 family)